MDPTRKVWPPPCPFCLSGAQRLQCQPEPQSTKPDTCLTHQRWRWRNWENIFSGQNDDETAPRTVKCESLTSLSLRWKQTKSLSLSAVSYVRERGPFWVPEAASFSGHLQHKIFISSRQLCTGKTTVTVSQMKMRETQHIHIYVCQTIPPISLGTNRTGNKHDINNWFYSSDGMVRNSYFLLLCYYFFPKYFYFYNQGKKPFFPQRDQSHAWW